MSMCSHLLLRRCPASTLSVTHSFMIIRPPFILPRPRLLTTTSSPFSSSSSEPSNPDASLTSLSKSTPMSSNSVLKPECGPLPSPEDDEEEEDEEEMWITGPTLDKQEWGGPTRGGRMSEPTMHGDWSRMGRCSDF